VRRAYVVGVPPVVLGKPSSTLINHIISSHNTKHDRMCMIGDRLDTDVLFGLNHGLRTVLTLSGTTSYETLTSSQNKIVPDYYIDSIADLIDLSRKTSFA
jgi:phosphoglycolate phosphatase